jgi:hypothetical protein
MINAEELKRFKEKTDMALSQLGLVVHFDHYGVKVPGGKVYEEARDGYGELYNEVVLSNRRVATLVGEDVIELLEPKDDEVIDEIFVEHTAYWVDDFKQEKSKFSAFEAEFKFGKTEGFKVVLDGIIVEIRNNTLVDSKGDV